MRCKTCGYELSPQAGQDKCPNCSNNPYILPESYTKEEWNGRQMIRRKSVTQTLPRIKDSLI